MYIVQLQMSYLMNWASNTSHFVIFSDILFGLETHIYRGLAVQVFTVLVQGFRVNPFSAEFVHKNFGDQRVYFNLISS